MQGDLLVDQYQSMFHTKNIGSRVAEQSLVLATLLALPPWQSCGFQSPLKVNKGARKLAVVWEETAPVERIDSQPRSAKKPGSYVLSKLTASPSMRVLDFGCGNGALTVQIATSSGAQTVGIDKDARLVKAAVARGVDARTLDGYNLDFEEEFDAVVSSGALHCLPENHVKVLKGLRHSLKPGGKLVAELGGRGNVQSIVDALSSELESRGYSSKERNPWFFTTAEHYTWLLKKAGFAVQECELVAAPTKLDANINMEDWLRTFCGKWLEGIDATESRSILQAVLEDLRKYKSLYANGQWTIDYWNLRVVCLRKEAKAPASPGPLSPTSVSEPPSTGTVDINSEPEPSSTPVPVDDISTSRLQTTAAIVDAESSNDENDDGATYFTIYTPRPAA